MEDMQSQGLNVTAPTIDQFVALREINFMHSDYKTVNLSKLNQCDFTKAISDVCFTTLLNFRVQAAEGTGLAFIVFTQAMVEFPISPIWAILFFTMLLMLGLGSMFGTLEGVITSIHDLKLFPWLRKEILTGNYLGTNWTNLQPFSVAYRAVSASSLSRGRASTLSNYLMHSLADMAY